MNLTEIVVFLEQHDKSLMLLFVATIVVAIVVIVILLSARIEITVVNGKKQFIIKTTPITKSEGNK